MIDEVFETIKIENSKKTIYKCKVCDFICVIESLCKQHIKTKGHMNKINPPEKKEKVIPEYLKKITCEPCNKQMTQLYYDTYHKHTKVHLKKCNEHVQELVKCEYCNKSYTPYYMNFHIQNKTHLSKVEKSKNI